MFKTVGKYVLPFGCVLWTVCRDVVMESWAVDSLLLHLGDILGFSVL